MWVTSVTAISGEGKETMHSANSRIRGKNECPGGEFGLQQEYVRDAGKSIFYSVSFYKW
jgi:hypothetical protein